jgi:hypothetical protein
MKSWAIGVSTADGRALPQGLQRSWATTIILGRGSSGFIPRYGDHQEFSVYSKALEWRDLGRDWRTIATYGWVTVYRDEGGWHHSQMYSCQVDVDPYAYYDDTHRWFDHQHRRQGKFDLPVWE